MGSIHIEMSYWLSSLIVANDPMGLHYFVRSIEVYDGFIGFNGAVGFNNYLFQWMLWALLTPLHPMVHCFWE